MAEENTRLVLEREKEVHQIVRSINDLNEIFKDLATMVVDQVNVIWGFPLVLCFISVEDSSVVTHSRSFRAPFLTTLTTTSNKRQCESTRD